LHQNILLKRLDTLTILSEQVYSLLKTQSFTGEIPEKQWISFSRHLGLQRTTNYCIALDEKGFLFETIDFSLRYYHSPGTGRVVIAFKR